MRGVPFQSSRAVAGFLPASSERPTVVYRLAGDAYLLVEYGDMVLDLNLRFRVQSLINYLKSLDDSRIQELAPGVRSLLIKYDSLKLPLKKLITILTHAEEELPKTEDLILASRIVHLPLAFHDRWTREAIQKYMQSVRAEAPYLPDNVEFVARCNGFESGDQVLSAMISSQKMVLGLGDVYLGAPCAVPIDPLTRLVVPKYNPARTLTPEGAVGIGGSYICIYPMESPGGYQLVGRTLPIWNTYQSTPYFKETPWLLRIFDRIQFEHVEENHLEDAREAMLQGSYELSIEEGTFNVREYNENIQKSDTTELLATQRAAAEKWTKGY